MLSVGPGAHRFSPAQNVLIRNARFGNVHYRQHVSARLGLRITGLIAPTVAPDKTSTLASAIPAESLSEVGRDECSHNPKNCGGDETGTVTLIGNLQAK
jgi:hypothetical protein